jgi:CheY-like chemotaxis protein
VRRDRPVILVVDDDEFVRFVTVQMLSHFGYDVIEARNGPEALAVLESRNCEIDLLFTDIVMPGGMSGFVLAEEVLARCPGIRVLYTTGYPMMREQDVLKFHGEILPKPYLQPALYDAVTHALAA